MHYGEVTGDIVRYDDGWTYPSDGAMGGGVVITLKIASDHIERDLCPVKSPINRILIAFQLIKRAGKGVVVLSQDTPAQILSARKCRISSDSITNSSEIAGR